MSPDARPRLVERYRRFLPITDATPAISLGEGATPLVAAPRLGARLGVPNLHLKLEGLNPTGSFKDRGMVVAVAKALEGGYPEVARIIHGHPTLAEGVMEAARAADGWLIHG